MTPLVLMALLQSSSAWADPEAITATGSIPDLPFLRGVSIEKPTQLAFDHDEYKWVDWSACKELLKPYSSDSNPFSHSFLSMVSPEAKQLSGDRAACMTAAVIKRFPHLNVVRVPIEPGVRYSTPRARKGVCRPKGAADPGLRQPIALGNNGVFTITDSTIQLQVDYFRDLIEPILRVVQTENRRRSGSDDLPEIWVILDWHYIADGDGLGSTGTPWSYTDVEEPTRLFWEMVGKAEWMMQYDNVIFEVFNEPVLNVEHEKEGKRFKEQEVAEWSAGLSKIVEGLRQSPNGASRPIATPAPHWSARCQAGLVPEGEGLYQVEHQYTDMFNGLRSCDWKPARTGSFLATEVGGHHKKESKRDVPGVLDAMLKEYEAQAHQPSHRVMGWVAWIYGSDKHLPSLLTTKTCPLMMKKRKRAHSFSNVPLSVTGQQVEALLARPGSLAPGAGGQPVGLQPAAKP